MAVLAQRIIAKNKTDRYYFFMKIRMLQGILTFLKNLAKYWHMNIQISLEQRGFELQCLPIWGYFSINTINVFFLTYNFFSSNLFSLAYLIVRLQYIIHTMYKICVNWSLHYNNISSQELVISRYIYEKSMFTQIFGYTESLPPPPSVSALFKGQLCIKKCYMLG